MCGFERSHTKTLPRKGIEPLSLPDTKRSRERAALAGWMRSSSKAGPTPAPNKERLLPPRPEWTGLPQAEVL